MSMMRFALLGLILFLIRASSEWQLTKCCPPGQIYVNNFTNCESIPLFVIEVYVHYWNITREFQGIPQCDESEDLVTTPLDAFGFNTILEVPACLEYFYKSGEKKPVIIIRYCRSNKNQQVKANDTSFPQLLHTRKCCFGDTIFDSGTKTCVTRLNESQSLGALLLNRSTDTESAMILTQGPPKCEGPIVNYEINENDISLRNGTYLVKVPAFNNIVKEEPLTEDNACLEMTPDFALKRRLAVRICREPEFCDTNACIRKCCPEDTYASDGNCIRRPVPNEPGEFHNAFANAVSQINTFTFDTTKGYGVLTQMPCKAIHYSGNLNEWKEFVLLTSNGHVSILTRETNRYCFDVNHEVNNSHLEFSWCDTYTLADIYRSANWWLAMLLVKCVCLLMTLLVYAFLPSLQNIHGKTVICYVSSLLLTTILMFIRDLYNKIENEQLGKTSCKAIAYIVFFSSCTIFFWLNIMCFDIWRNIGTLRENRKNCNNRKRFLLYCLYGWGIPFLLTIIIIIVYNTDILPNHLKLNIDNVKCRLTQEANWNNYSEFIFGFGPQTILLISNVVFFILTLKYYNNVKTNIKNQTDSRSKQLHSSMKRFIMIVKLFIVMGMQWIFSTVNYYLFKNLGFYQHWRVILYINLVLDSLEGLLIFIIFVLKKSMYQAIRKRLQDIKKY